MVLVSIACIALSACGGGGSSTEEVSASHERSQALAGKTVGADVAAVTWTKATDQGSLFQLESARIVQFGYGNQWVKKKLSGSVLCDTTTFGTDPAPGVSKVCEIKTDPAPGITTLTWAASTDSDVTGYRVYYGAASHTYLQAPGNGISSGTQTDFTIAALPAGTLYYFAVTTVDAEGNESEFSNEVTKLLP